jgi:hypothetical protein
MRLARTPGGMALVAALAIVVPALAEDAARLPLEVGKYPADGVRQLRAQLRDPPRSADKRTGPRTVHFELHGGFYSGRGSPSCIKDKPITATPFSFKMLKERSGRQPLPKPVRWR